MTQNDSISIKVDEREFNKAVATAVNMHKSITEKWMQSTHRKHLRPIASAMKAGSKSSRIEKMVGVTTAKRKAPPYGAKVGVIKNDKKLFPKFSAQALASVIEYGTPERFRGTKKGSFTMGAIPTGKVAPEPWLRPAWDQNVQTYMKHTEQDIIHKIEMEAKKA